MNLFLSSQGIPNSLRPAFLSLFAKEPKDIRLAYIATAAEPYPREQRGWERQAWADITATGAQLAPLDLKAFADPMQLKQTLSTYDGLWASGGHTYWLRYWVRESGLEAILPSLLQEGFVYSGFSAAAMICGNTLEVFDRFDPEDQEVLEPKRTHAGLNLLPFAILPHWQCSEPERAAWTQKISAAFAAEGKPLQTLTDQQAIVMRGGAWELLSAD